jgi:hypothetical protein
MTSPRPALHTRHPGELDPHRKLAAETRSHREKGGLRCVKRWRHPDGRFVESSMSRSIPQHDLEYTYRWTISRTQEGDTQSIHITQYTMCDLCEGIPTAPGDRGPALSRLLIATLARGDNDLHVHTFGPTYCSCHDARSGHSTALSRDSGARGHSRHP